MKGVMLRSQVANSQWTFFCLPETHSWQHKHSCACVRTGRHMTEQSTNFKKSYIKKNYVPVTSIIKFLYLLITALHYAHFSQQLDFSRNLVVNDLVQNLEHPWSAPTSVIRVNAVGVSSPDPMWSPIPHFISACTPLSSYKVENFDCNVRCYYIKKQNQSFSCICLAI